MNGVRTDARRTGRRGSDGVSSDLTAIGRAVIEGKDISVVILLTCNALGRVR